MTALALSRAAENDPLERARRHAEGMLFEPMNLGELASVAGLSPYHFSRQFAGRFGQSPMAYVRALRLASAAARLAGQPPPALVDLAFDCGFDTQEGFTRAFKRAFGVPPGRFRRDGGPPHLLETSAMDDVTDAPIQLTEAPAPIRKGAMRIAGLAGLFDDSNKADIPKLWDRLVPMLPFKGQVGEETFGVCCAAPVGAEPGAMRYMAGAPIADAAAVPEGMEVIELTPQTYLVFRQVMDGGPVHPQMQAATREIWGRRVPASGRRLVQAPDLEFYPADSTPDQAGAWVEWWLPVEA